MCTYIYTACMRVRNSDCVCVYVYVRLCECTCVFLCICASLCLDVRAQERPVFNNKLSSNVIFKLCVCDVWSVDGLV